MRGLVAPTDFKWYERLSTLPNLDEVNFWQPASYRPVRSIVPGEPFFFKLKAPHNAIGGFGLFARGCSSPASYAWDAFGERNGVGSHAELIERCVKYRKHLRKPPLEAGEDPEIGCLMIAQPVFFTKQDWIPQPTDWQKNTISPTGYDLARGEGARIWSACVARARGLNVIVEEPARYGTARLVAPRLGQGIFRLSVADAYSRACAITQEHSLPALEAAHIKPFSIGGVHSVRNGLLFRADIHRLFDAGYVTVMPDGVFRVSPRLKKDWSNGRSYYPLDGERIKLPAFAGEHPDGDLLTWHNVNRFKSAGA